MHLFGYNNEGLNKPLVDPWSQKPIVTASSLKLQLDSGKVLIAGVNADRSSGALNQGDTTGHWIVVNDITLDENGKYSVQVYNPIPNKLETYDYDMFMNSFSAFGDPSNLSDSSGVWVDLPTDRGDPRVTTSP